MRTDRHFSTEDHAGEGARDLRLALAWIAALLLAGSAANLIAMWFGAGQ
jgi:hypothetical protein